MGRGRFKYIYISELFNTLMDLFISFSESSTGIQLEITEGFVVC